MNHLVGNKMKPAWFIDIDGFLEYFHDAGIEQKYDLPKYRYLIPDVRKSLSADGILH